jgi:endogenous inhibitor of DNA gyrase (YacG/DUF329 family)
MAMDRDALEDLVSRLRQMQADVSRLRELIVKESPRRRPSDTQPPAWPEPRQEAASVPAPCPYCGRPMRSSAGRPRHGAFECERCGEFLDFRRSSSEWPRIAAGDRERERPRPSKQVAEKGGNLSLELKTENQAAFSTAC